MKTKMFATVLAMLMLLTVVVASPVSAADGVVVKGAEVVVPFGTTEAEVTVSVTGLPAGGLLSACFNTRVDGAVITSGEAAESLGGEKVVGPTDKAASEGVNFMWAYNEAIKEDTVLVTFKVVIPSDAACGTVYNVIITPTDDPDDFLSGDDGLPGVGATAENGKIVIGHSLTHVEAVAATPEADGNIEYWKCEKCEKLFSDEAGTTEIKIEDTVTKYEKPDYTPGDVNGDGDINAKDIMAIMRHLLNNTPDNFNVAAADFNNDGDINAKDIMAIMRHILNK